MIVPAGSRIGLVRRAWGLRTQTIERQKAVPHFEGRVVEVALPVGVELNCDGEFVDGGLERVTARANAFRLGGAGERRAVEGGDDRDRSRERDPRATITTALDKGVGQVLQDA